MIIKIKSNLCKCSVQLITSSDKGSASPPVTVTLNLKKWTQVMSLESALARVLCRSPPQATLAAISIWCWSCIVGNVVG